MSDVNFRWAAQALLSVAGGIALVLWGPPEAKSLGVGMLGAFLGQITTANQTVTK